VAGGKMTRGLDRLFFVPHGANSGFHTVDQIATIETALALLELTYSL
jgi:hypothetical protein